VTCAEFLKELNEFLDGDLDPKLKAELDSHLTWCYNCFVVCDTTKKTIKIYKESQIYELPEDTRSKLQTAILSKCKNARPKQSQKNS
jgi:hypothetical protein